MVLRIDYAGDRKFPVGEAETSRTVVEALESSSFERRPVTFALMDPPAEFPVAYLTVSVSADHSCGALVWWASGSLLEKGGVYGNIWLSDNPQPPVADPDVVSDAYTGRRHDPASTLPIHRIRTAVEEYRRTGTGARPECIDWVTGEMNGQRHDRPIVED
ncbi:Imm1 family immunity protein [Kitasatospora sp. NPDC058170]|uniref:Imm1 family immunity protein n=1 Tax=Kitasatospora sp. NPDC058170 TaxID=3346364 RepID=UPI0036D8AB89